MRLESLLFTFRIRVNLAAPASVSLAFGGMISAFISYLCRNYYELLLERRAAEGGRNNLL